MREHWGTRLGFILATLGSAIGLGTLWKFPYVTGNNGGGSFILAYLLFTCVIGIPLFIGELLLGRRAQRGAVGVFATLSGERSGWRTIGWLGVLSAFLILSYYCIVAGWGLNYVMLSLNHAPDESAHTFKILLQSGDIGLFWGFVFLLMTFGVIFQGLRKGIELWGRILMIGLLALLLFLCVYAMTLEGFGEAMRFLFRPHFAELKPSGVIEALGLSLFTLSLAQGIILTYGSYLKNSEDLPKTALIIGLTVVLVSFLVVCIIFPVIFTFDLPHQGGPGLIFETLPLLFDRLPGSLLISVAFFTLFVFAALTSAIALLEVIVANLIDLYHWSRKKAALVATAAVFVVSIPSAFSFKIWRLMYGGDFMETMDNFVSIWLLPVGALLTALYIGWRQKKAVIRESFLQGTTLGYLFAGWYFLVRWVAPVAILLVFLQKGGFINLDNLLYR